MLTVFHESVRAVCARADHTVMDAAIRCDRENLKVVSVVTLASCSGLVHIPQPGRHNGRRIASNSGFSCRLSVACPAWAESAMPLPKQIGEVALVVVRRRAPERDREPCRPPARGRPAPRSILLDEHNLGRRPCSSGLAQHEAGRAFRPLVGIDDSQGPSDHAEDPLHFSAESQSDRGVKRN